MSTNFSAVIKRGHCTIHDEHANTCRQCIWLRMEQYRKERDNLLAALKRMVAKVNNPGSDSAESVMEMAEGAIAKAEGRQP